MFSVEDRTALRDRLIEQARRRPEVTAAALLGSAARDEEDAWSDIDLALRLAPGADPREVADAWTAWLGADHDLIDQLDLWAGGGLYRVLLFGSTLQVDLSFWPSHAFAPQGPDFALVFGAVATSPETSDQPEESGRNGHDHLRWAWLYALHVRSAIARGRRWQAVHLLDGLRDQLIGSACRRHGLSEHEGRGVDRLPAAFTDRLGQTLIESTQDDELRRVFEALIGLVLEEIEVVAREEALRQAPGAGARLAQALREIVASTP